jgi:membrane-bound ClpP family serine protease
MVSLFVSLPSFVAVCRLKLSFVSFGSKFSAAGMVRFFLFFLSVTLYILVSVGLLNSKSGAFRGLSRADWACLGLIILGVILFLYGANFYDNFVGWTGVFMFVGGILAWIVLYVYGEVMKRKTQSA